MEKKKILVVEDEFLIAKGTKYILEEEGYDVIANVDCFDCAVDMIEERQPDLVLIDININGEMDGIALGRYLLNKDDIPFIYVSSHTDKITMERVKDTRPYGFVVKPYKEVDLITTVSLVLSNFKQRLLDPKRNEELEESKIDEVPFRIRAVVDYINEHINEKIEITKKPLISIYGKDDPYIQHHEIMESWNKYSEKWFGSYALEGNHFYFMNQDILLNTLQIIQSNAEKSL